MPIEALPPSTVRAIGSTSVISDPCSVVKELLDNALDASATSVFIEISQNTVDLIQVKDNGHGIPVGDHAFVCKRAYTSKIQTVDDLRKLGGSSLGFRGEALASAAEVSGSVHVITRIDTQPVGSLLKYGRDGDLIKSENASHPCGTTVRVVDLFKHIPVRRQTTLKNTTKTLVRIKKLIQEYAAAQPSKRISLKVLKAKSEKLNWMYAPKSDATLLDAARKIGGTDATSVCVVKTYPPSQSCSDDDVVDSDLNYSITAVLPAPDADLSKANNLGQYISVDGRPISATRGIGQDITKTYKSYLRSAGARNGLSTSITDPLLCLHIYCGESTYDVNIEPSKDDVLFENKEQILQIVENLFRNLYGDIEGRSNKTSGSDKGKEPVQQRNGFELLLSQSSASSSPPITNIVTQPSAPAFKPFRSPLHLASDSSDGVSRGHINGQTTGNGRSSDESSLPTHHERDRTLWTITPKTTPKIPPQSPCLPSPSTASSRSIPASPINPSSSNTTLGFSQPSQNRVHESKRASRERDRERYGNGSLDTWFGKTTQVALSRMATEGAPPMESEEPSLTQLATHRFGSHNPAPSIHSTSGHEPSERPVVPLSPHDHPSPGSQSPSQMAQEHLSSNALDKRLDHWSYRIHQLFKSAAQPGLEEALDFENRKKEAIQQRREQMKSRMERHPPSSSPHHNRYLAARAALHEDQPSLSTQHESPALNPHDPRAYLMRKRAKGSDDVPKPARINSSKLPFETIPEGQGLYDVGLTQTNDLFSLSRLFSEAFEHDLYTQSGEEYDGLTVSDSESDIFASWTSRLSSLIQSQYRREGESGTPDLHFDFSSIVHSPTSPK